MKKLYMYIRILVKEMNLNKKGFAISTMLYGLVFVTIAIFYLIIAMVSGRHETNEEYTESVRSELNGLEIVVSWR